MSCPARRRTIRYALSKNQRGGDSQGHRRIYNSMWMYSVPNTQSQLCKRCSVAGCVVKSLGVAAMAHESPIQSPVRALVLVHG